jgi:hypothetical protein
MIHFTTLSDSSLDIIFSRSIPITTFRSKRLHQRITIAHHQPRNPISLAVLLKPATVKQNDSTEASIDASIASLQEIERNWN